MEELWKNLKEVEEKNIFSMNGLVFSEFELKRDGNAGRKLENCLSAFIGSFSESISFYWYFSTSQCSRIVFHLETYNIEGKNVKRVI